MSAVDTFLNVVQIATIKFVRPSHSLSALQHDVNLSPLPTMTRHSDARASSGMY